MKSKIKEIISKSNKIVLLTHENPDGDAIGSLIAFYRVLKSLDKEVYMVASDIPNRFKCLEDLKMIVIDRKDDFDLAIVVDCASKERVFQGSNILDSCKYMIAIDHHIWNNEYADINYVDGNVSACCQVLYYLFKDLNYKIDNECAKSLMIGLLTDTNGFKNDNVDKNSFLMAAEIKDMGVDVYNLGREVLTKISSPQYKLMKLTINRLEFFLDGKIAFSYVTHDEMIKYAAKKGDHEGLVEIGRNIDGVEVSIFMREEDGFLVSFRSNEIVDVSQIAKSFGGGGHKLAAGAKIDKNLEEAKELVINEVMKATIEK